jgi:D-alanine-D-alanine ligase
MPAIIKPLNSGSSIDIHTVFTAADITKALTSLFETYDSVLIEEFISGKEATVGVVEGFRNESLYSLLPTEIRKPAKAYIFDSAMKYGDAVELMTPGVFHKDEIAELQRIAREAHKELGLRHYSCSDFIVHPKRGIYLLETNSLPGLTEQSLLPHGLEAVGSSLKEFLEHVVTLALSEKKR